MGNVESFLALEMALNSYPLSYYVLFLLKHYLTKNHPWGQAYVRKVLGLKN